MPFTKENPVFDKLAILAAYDNLSEADKIAYDREKMRKWDIYSVEQTRKKRAKEQREKDRKAKERIKAAREQAKEQIKAAKEELKEAKVQAKEAKEQAKEAKMQAKLETAANLKEMGVPMDTIIAATGLTQEQVEAL